MTWLHVLCFGAGLATLLSQRFWERKRARVRAAGGDYTRFDFPLAMTLATLAGVGILDVAYPEITGLWWAWGAGALFVAVPTIVARILQGRSTDSESSL